MNIEDYIKGLDPDLQEKVRTCSSVEELVALAKEAKVPLPDEMLEAVAGGDQPDPENCKPIKCPKCGSTKVTFDMLINEFECQACGYIWF